jgi:hypothetical protein
LTVTAESVAFPTPSTLKVTSVPSEITSTICGVVLIGKSIESGMPSTLSTTAPLFKSSVTSFVVPVMADSLIYSRNAASLQTIHTVDPVTPAVKLIEPSKWTV